MNTNNQPFYGACAVINRMADGTQHRIAALIPNEKVRQGYFDRAKHLAVLLTNIWKTISALNITVKSKKS